MRTLQNDYADGIFDVSPDCGFLTIKQPYGSLLEIGDQFGSLQRILDLMPVQKNSEGVPGLLSQPGELQKAVFSTLPNLLKECRKVAHDRFAMQALYRAYTFLSSAYLLEPAFHTFRLTGDYGKANNILPAKLSQPLCFVAGQLDVYPWLDYSYAYSLGNVTFKDPNLRTAEALYDYNNLKMACSFSGGEDENGFIMLHVDINQYSPDLISAIRSTLQGLVEFDPVYVSKGLRQCYETMVKINQRRKLMWQASDHHRYNDFRIFIMGIKGNEELFGEGVLYEGVSSENNLKAKTENSFDTSSHTSRNLHSYRGQTGAQDSIIPTVDIFTGLDSFYPQNELTEYLMDLRTYRPKVFQRYLNDLREDCSNMFDLISDLCVRSDSRSDSQSNDPTPLIYLLALVEQVYFFRNGHWQFVQKYIMKNTRYSKATGGTPILRWIPNQIDATLRYMNKILDRLADLNGSDLNGSDLNGSDLNGSDLNGSDLNGSDLKVNLNCVGSDLNVNLNCVGSDLKDIDQSVYDLYHRIRENFESKCELLQKQMEQLSGAKAGRDQRCVADSVFAANTELKLRDDE
jgi:indoleamine 2,3-dioxygenase